MNTKLALDEKYQQLKEIGGHEQKSTMGIIRDDFYGKYI